MQKLISASWISPLPLCWNPSRYHLATVYSLIIGMFLSVFLAKNLTPFKWISTVLSAVLTFLRAIPSIIWVLLVLVCVGFGPSAGIIGICIFSTSFFARSFAQCFEEVPEETLEALRAMGAGRIKIFLAPFCRRRLLEFWPGPPSALKTILALLLCWAPWAPEESAMWFPTV